MLRISAIANSPARRCLQGALVALTSLPLLGCARSILDGGGPVASQDAKILLNALAVMLAIVIPTIVAALWFAWWFRASNTRARYRPNFAYSGRIELLVWSIPILTIAFLGGLIVLGSYQLDPRRPIASDQPPLEIQVVSLDWKWLFIYPEQHVASVQQLVIPVGRPVRFSITSASVMNVFFVPRLSSQIYAMNGMVTQMNIRADAPGTYEGLSAHFSGDGFPHMRFPARVVTPEAFQAWVQAARSAGPQLDASAYAALQRQTAGAPMSTYRDVQPGLFQAVADQRFPPSPGPQVGRGGAAVSPRSEN